MNKTLAILFIFLFCSFSLFADEWEYEYHPRISLYLGAGFDPCNIRKAYAACIDCSEIINHDGPGAYKTDLIMKVVHSARELLNEVGISASVSAQSFFASGKTGISYLSESSFHEDSITLLILGTVDYGRTGLKKHVLLPEAKSSLMKENLTNLPNVAEFVT